MDAKAQLKRPALGRGLGALIPGGSPSERKGVMNLGIEEIRPNRHQPRRHFDEGHIEELAESIRSKGVLLPLIVRRANDGYVLVAGERRWRAAQRAGLRELPVMVREVSEKEAFELALIENIQREDLNPVEEAEAYKRLIEEHGLTQEELAARVGIDPASRPDPHERRKQEGRVDDRSCCGVEVVVLAGDELSDLVNEEADTDASQHRRRAVHGAPGKHQREQGRDEEQDPAKQGMRDVQLPATDAGVAGELQE